APTTDTPPPQPVGVGNGVSNNQHGSTEGQSARLSGNAVSNSAAVGGDGETTPTFGNAVSKHSTEPIEPSSLPTDPADLALVIEREYSAEQRAALLSLLQG